MTEGQALLAAALPVLGLIGGGIRWLLTWYLNRTEAHDKAMADRFEKMQTLFMTELEKLETEKERHRTEHLIDTKTYAASLAQVTAFLQTLPASQRPPPKTPSSSG